MSHVIYQRKFASMLEKTEQKINKAVEHFKGEVARIRTGRAKTTLVDDIKVNYYGQPTSLQEIASAATIGPRELQIKVWDANAADNVEKALSEADLGATPNRKDEKTFIINLPSLTGEARKRMINKLHNLAEEARVAVRNIREEKWKKVQSREREGKITEDDKYTFKDKLQDLVDEANEEIEEVMETKEEQLTPDL